MKKEKYIKDVLKSINATGNIKKRIREDLNERIDRAMDEDPFFDVINSIGFPEEVAKEFTENLEEAEMIMTHINVGFSGLTSNRAFEYKSEASLFGLPLVHVNTGGRYTNRNAKGIIAIGDVATGVIALGGVAVGLISFGGIGIGLLGVGGIGIGLLGIGGVGIGLQAIGGVAVGIAGAFGAVTQLLFK